MCISLDVLSFKSVVPILPNTPAVASLLFWFSIVYGLHGSRRLAGETCSAMMAVGKRSNGGGSTPNEWDPETWFGSPLTSHFCRAATNCRVSSLSPFLRFPETPMGGRLTNRLDAGIPENGHQHCDNNGLDCCKDNLRQSNPNKRWTLDGCFRYPIRQRQRQIKPTNQPIK